MLMVAPITSSPGPLSAGMLSPVIMDSSTADVPSTTTASTGILSPGLTSSVSPTPTRSTGTSASEPSSFTPAGHGGLEVHELPHGGRGPALRRVLQKAARQHQGDYDGRGVEVDPRGRKEAGDEGDHRGVRPRGRGAERDEGVHVPHPAPDAVVGPPVEPPPDDELDGSLEREESVVRGLRGQGSRVGEEEDRHGQERGGRELQPELPQLLLGREELAHAALAAEVVGDAPDLGLQLRCGLVDVHSTHRVGRHWSGGARRRS